MTSRRPTDTDPAILSVDGRDSTSSYPSYYQRRKSSAVSQRRTTAGTITGLSSPDGTDSAGASAQATQHSGSPYEYRDDDDDILNSKIGIYGWRKRLLYLLMISMTVIVILNLALLVWITRIMNFNLDGMGNLRIHDDRITVQGRSEFAQGLFTQSVRSEQNEALRLLSTQGVNITAGQAYFQLGSQNIEARAGQFEIRDSNGTVYFAVNPRRLQASADSIILNGSRGAAFQEFIQTREVRGEEGRGLQLQSPSGSMTLRSGAALNIAASGSGISLSSPSNVRLNAGNGNLTLSSANLLLPQLPVIGPPPPDGQPTATNVFEVCVCNTTGALFLAPAIGAGTISPCHAAANDGCR